MNTNRGLLYIVIGSDNAKEAILSLKSARRLVPNIAACAYSTRIKNRHVKRRIHEIFDISKPLLINASKYPDKRLPINCNANRFLAMRAKSRLLGMSPFSKTLFLDTDTYINSKRFMDPFDMLNQYDLLCTKAMNPKFNRYCQMIPKAAAKKEINNGIDHYGSGVVYFKKTDAVIKLSDLWEKLWLKYSIQCPPDQMSFSLAIRNSGFARRMRCLPVKYNFTAMSAKECGPDAAILHYQRPAYMKYLTKWCHISKNEIVDKIIKGCPA
jgi:hypothetical protein